jgi:hypothetical protein
MAEHFSLRHIPALIVASFSTLGGIWPMLDAKGAMLAFGLPSHVAGNPATHPIMVNGRARGTVLGLLTFIFYFQRKYTEIDILIAVFGVYAGLVDGYLLWKFRNRGMAAWHLVASWTWAAWGLAGLTGTSN